MQQKVQFIATLVHDPDLVILDEPFSGLDPINAQALKDAVVELKRRGKTVVFSTHVMENAERMCDAVCIIARGEKVLDGQVTEVQASAVAGTWRWRSSEHGGERERRRRRPRRPEARQALRRQQSLFRDRARPGADAQDLLHRLVEAGARIERFELMLPSLHQIFIERVGASGVETGMSGHG